MEEFLPADERINVLFRTVRHSGFKITQARRTVIETLAEQKGHLTAPDLVQAVQRRAPDIGRASVYRTLDLLTRLGLAQTSTLGGAAATYVLTPDQHHHHVVCTECHKTIEFEECGLQELERRLGERLGFQLCGHLLEVYGLCPDCLT